MCVRVCVCVHYFSTTAAATPTRRSMCDARNFNGRLWSWEFLLPQTPPPLPPPLCAPLCLRFATTSVFYVLFVSFRIYCFYPYCFSLIPKSNRFLLICLFVINCSAIQKHGSGKLYRQNTTRVTIVMPFERKEHFDTFQSLF